VEERGVEQTVDTRQGGFLRADQRTGAVRGGIMIIEEGYIWRLPAFGRWWSPLPPGLGSTGRRTSILIVENGIFRRDAESGDRS
jgi:hypothetical protein